MSDLTEKQLSHSDIYIGKVLHLAVDKVMLPDGKEAEREYCIHVGAVCVIPLLSDGRVIMERQYRYPHRRIVLEIPAGKLNSPDEDRLCAAERELREETGAVAEKMTPLGDIIPSPAILSEKISLYLAEGISFKERKLDEDEFLDVELIHIDRLYEMVMRGEIEDAKTQIAILKTVALLSERRKKDG